ncbi:MAG: HAD family phosphatase [Aeromicrobium sp.]|uniref:HAD family hydrolase n=1 Tax=Aeromicrobium sp. TaxID=1871063 RepID=UPI0039E453B1
MLSIAPAAVLWDLDGTLVDTEPLWFAAETELAARLGGVWTPRDAIGLVGSDLRAAGRRLRERFDADMEADEIVDFLVARVRQGLVGGTPWRPGARELFAAYAALGVPQALVTMSYATLAEPVVAALPFAAVVTGDRVRHGKPHPEPYLTAAAELGVDPAACLAVEDSETGATSATEAGCFVLTVPHMVPIAARSRRRQAVSLRDLTPEGVVALWAEG